MPEENPNLPDEIYAVFAGPINENAPGRILPAFAQAINSGVKRVHLLMHSYGGNVGDGICLYNFFRSVPIDLAVYNVGNISSAAVTAFLGAKERKTSAHAVFMVHRTQAVPQSATTERLHALAQSVAIDDDRTEAILRQHLKLPQEKWDVHRIADLWLTANEAVECGLATELAEFAPLVGSKVFNV